MQEQKNNILYLVTTLLLVVLLCFCFTFSTFIVQKQATQQCYAEIEGIGQQMAYTLQYGMELNRYQLNTIAEMLPYDLENDQPAVKAILDNLCRSREMEAIFLQLPDGTVIQGGRALPISDALHSFRHDAENVPYISDICRSNSSRGPGYVYQAIAIVRDGQTAGILYGFLNLESFPGFFHIHQFQGQSQLYIVDGSTGDYLMDTWHSQLGNLSQLEELETRSGYRLDTMRQDLKAGKSGLFVFRSRETGEWMYTYYMPSGINDWSVQVTVSERTAYSQVGAANRVILALAAVILLLTLSYFIFSFLHQYRSSKANRLRLQQTDFMYQVQQILFDAYENPELMNHAMELVAKVYEAESATLIALKGRFVHHVYVWTADGSPVLTETRGRSLLRDFPKLYPHLLDGKDFLYSQQSDDDILSLMEQQALEARFVRNMLSVPLIDSKGELKGILCVLNTRKRQKDCSLLHSVKDDFSRALKNMDSYQIIHNMGIMDSLTGLKNRNSFESSMIRYASIPCCVLYSIYIDVNGLHEINNQFGHSAGDSMLRVVAAQVRAIFGDQHSYRIGGDEFAVFVLDMEEAELLQRIEDLKQCVRSNDYHISVGYAVQDGRHLNIDALLLEAEEQMYLDKQQFYMENDPEKNVRSRNTRMEKLLQEKKDADNFVDLISSHYMGIYVIDLKKDVARTLYNPGCFGDILEKHNQRYLESVKLYVQRFVVEKDRQAFLAFCDYDWIRREFQENRRPKMSYRKQDGTHVCIRLFPTRDYSEDAQEIFWFFEKLPE